MLRGTRVPNSVKFVIPGRVDTGVPPEEIQYSSAGCRFSADKRQPTMPALNDNRNCFVHYHVGEPHL